MRVTRYLVLCVASFTVAYGQSDPQGGSHEQIMAHYRQAEAALAEGHSDEAASEFRAILKIDPTNAEAYANLGVIAYKAGKFSGAAQLFTRALKYRPAMDDAKAFLGLSELREGQSKEGLELLETVFPRIRNKDVKIEAGVAIISAHQAARTLPEAVDVVRDLQTSYPDNPEVQYVAYRAYSDLAAQAVAALSKSGTDSGRIHQVLGEAAMSEDDFPHAIENFRKAMALDPSLPGIHYELGRAIRTNSQDDAALEEAQQEFETQLSIDPSDVNSEVALADVLRLRGKLDLAEQHYRTALRLEPNLPEADIALGIVLLDAGKPEAAITYLKAGVRLDPENKSGHFALARAYRTVGQIDDARREAAEVQKLEAAHPPPLITPKPNAQR